MEEAPLVYALVHALDRVLTGDMVFRSPTGDPHTVTFFKGAPVRVESATAARATADTRIGEDLVATEHLREESLATALSEAGSSRRRIGELLVHAGAVEPATLTEALAAQTAKRLALLANLAPESTFSLYLSARVEPEPFAPWAPLDTLLATIRAWGDRTRLHATLRWLADKHLRLVAETDLAGVRLTAREREAVERMQREPVSLKSLYADAGKGLSSLLYLLAVTRQLTVTSAKGAPMGVPTESEPAGGPVKGAAPQEAAIAPDFDARETATVPTELPDPPPRPGATWSVPLPPSPTPPSNAPPAKPIASTAPTAVMTPARPLTPGPLPLTPPPPAVSAPARPAGRPSTSPAKFVDPGRPQSRIIDHTPASSLAARSSEFRLAEEAVKAHQYETADRILQERCTEEDAVEPDFQALAAWVKANLNKADLTTPLNDLTFLLMAHTGCESGLYYRGLLLKRAGKEKAALRDFVTLAKQNPTHGGALNEIKQLRESQKKV